MRKKISTLMLAAVALLASCSQDEALQSDNNTGNGLKTVTITASLPDGSMTTRATANDDLQATNCYVQVRKADGTLLDGDEAAPRKMEQNGSGFSLTLTLNPEESYQFLFWADNTTVDYSTGDLTSVPYDGGATGKVIAFAEKLDNQAWSQNGISVNLKHVVTRISVKSTTDAAIDDQRTLTVIVPTFYTAYNVQDMAPLEASAEANLIYSGFTSATNATPDAPAQMGFFYTLQGNDQTATQPLTLHYDGDLHNPEVTIANVPLRPNYHVTLQGDVRNAGLVQGNITVSVNPDWDTDTDDPVEF